MPLRNSFCVILAAIALSACDAGDGGGGGARPSAVAPPTEAETERPRIGARERRPEDNLHYSGQGNSGGILAHQGGAFRGQLEATVTKGSTRPSNADMYYTEGHTIEFHNGPLTGIQVSCGYGYRGHSRICTTRNAKEADIVNQFVSEYGMAAIVTVSGFGKGRNESATVGLHTRNPNAPGNLAGVKTLMPTGTVNYDGDFRAAMTYRDDKTAFSGTAYGQTRLTADFDAGRISGNFTTQIGGADPVKVTGSFRNAVMNDQGKFFTAAGTTFRFGGEAAKGMVEGGIYGPVGQEAVGTMAFDNARGSMTGVFVSRERR
jgi:hypothetical protein